MAVALTAPAAFRTTYAASPQRHERAAQLLGGGQGADALPHILRDIMTQVGMPSGLAEVGYTVDDIPDLVAGTRAQQRLLALAPLELSDEDLAAIFEESL